MRALRNTGTLFAISFVFFFTHLRTSGESPLASVAVVIDPPIQGEPAGVVIQLGNSIRVPIKSLATLKEVAVRLCCIICNGIATRPLHNCNLYSDLYSTK